MGQSFSGTPAYRSDTVPHETETLKLKPPV
jgi:hypothetical protein